MADAVDTLVIHSVPNRYVARFTNVSDGTGESAVVKVDISALTGPNGLSAPTSTAVREILWNIQGFTSVRLFWDHSTDDEIKVLSGTGYADYTDFGGLRDPKSAGGTGDILLTTAGNDSGDTYDITLVLELRD